MIEKLVELRKKLKARKPTFIRHDAHKKARVDGTVWRKPKGRQNKMRLHKKGYARDRSSGYGSPKGAYGLSAQGLQQIVVRTADQLVVLDPKTQGAIISRHVGDRKRADLLKIAQTKSITVLNISQEKFDKRIAQALALKKDHKKELSKRKDSKEKAVAAKKKEEKKEADKAAKKDESSKSEEEKKIEEKKEHDKILVQKGDEV